MRLTLYILWHFLLSFLRVSLFLMVLVFLVDFVNQLAQFSPRGVPASKIFIFSLFRIPDGFLEFLPLIVLLAALFCFLGLARSSEIVVMRAAGIPATRFVFVPVVTVGIFGLLIMSLLNPVFVSARLSTQSYENQFTNRPDDFISITRENGIWLRSKQDGLTRLFRLGDVDWNNESARDVTIYSIDPPGNITEINSPSAKLVDGQWELRPANVVSFSNIVSIEEKELVKINTKSEFNSFFSEYFNPRNLRNLELPEYIRARERDGYDSRAAQSYFYTQLSLPVMLMTLCLIGSIFALAPQRMGGTTKRVFLSIITGFIVYGAARFTQSLGVAGIIPVSLSVIAIPIPAFFIALSFLLSQEDG